MKMTKLLVGAAALALSAGAAHADEIYQGAATVYAPAFGQSVGSFNSEDTTTLPWWLGGGTLPTGLWGIEALDALGIESNDNQPYVSMILIEGEAAGNTGQTDTSHTAKFNLSGTVDEDCAFYVGDVNTDIDFGTIGIHTADVSGPSQAFDMADDAFVEIRTNLAGCNTQSKVTITKTNGVAGLQNLGGGAFDSDVFTRALPYSVTATYTATPDVTQAGTREDWVEVDANEAGGSAVHGAWKSDMLIRVDIEAPSLSLLAGEYSDELTITVAAI